MAKTTLNDKTARVLKLIMGLRNTRVSAAMSAFGFTDADLQEGWHLLQEVTRVKLDAEAKAPTSGIIAKIDAWENRWFPIAAATLERRFPAVHAQVFKNLSQTSGPAVAVSVQTFIDRFEQMATGASSYGPDGMTAHAMLETRGLTASVLEEARALLDVFSKVSPPHDVSTVEAEQKLLADAEARLWGWYREWSQIARVAITQRGLLRQMGFASARGRPSADGADNTADGEASPESTAEPSSSAPPQH